MIHISHCKYERRFYSNTSIAHQRQANGQKLSLLHLLFISILIFGIDIISSFSEAIFEIVMEERACDNSETLLVSSATLKKEIAINETRTE